MALSRRTTKQIRAAIDALFQKMRARLLGQSRQIPSDKIIAVVSNRDTTLQGLYEAAARAAGGTPDAGVIRTIEDVVGAHLDAAHSRAEAHILREAAAVEAEAQASGKPSELAATLGTRLAGVWRKVTEDVARIVDTEGTQVRNLGVLEGVTKIAALRGEDDPVVYWVVTRRDPYPCSECRRLHLMDDGLTPRCWRLSEIGHSYHKHGDANPKVGGLHPFCKCSQAGLSPGFGFDATGHLVYKGDGWDELAHQRRTST